MIRIDPDGNLDDWWLNNETGEAEYIENKKVWHSEEMAEKGYSYLGEYQITENIYISNPEIFNAYQDVWAPGINVNGEQYGRWNLGGKEGSFEGHADPVNSGDLSSDIPDYAALSISGTAIIGGGGGLDGTIGYVKGDGGFVNGSLRVGSGFDISFGIGFTIGNYTGTDKPTALSTAGANLYENGGAGFVSITLQQDVSSKNSKARIGKYWNYGSLGLTFGSKSFFGGSAGTSITTKPLYLYKEQ